MGAPPHQPNLLPMILIISLDGWIGPLGYKQGGRHNRWKKLSPWNPRRNRHHIPPWTGVSKKWESTVQEPEDGILPFSQGCLLSRVGFLVDLYLSIFFNHFTFCSFVSFSFCFFLLILQRTVTKPAYVLRTHTVHVNHAQSFPSEWATKFQQAKHSSLNLQILWRGITLQSDLFYKLRVLGAKPHRPIYISFRESFTLWCPELSMINLSLKSLRDFRKGFQRRRYTKRG